MNEGSQIQLNIPAVKEKLPEVSAQIGALLEETGCPMKIRMQVDLAVEEIFVNIASYAYGEEGGDVCIIAGLDKEMSEITVTFIDRGIRYDPLSSENPDITLPVSEREIGGLGIFLTKRSMDELSYEYSEGRNILKMKKKLRPLKCP